MEIKDASPNPLTDPCHLSSWVGFPHAEPIAVTFSGSDDTILLQWKGSPGLMRLNLNSPESSLTLYPFQKDKSSLLIPRSWIALKERPIRFSLESFLLSQGLKLDKESELSALLLATTRPRWKVIFSLLP
jgi:hypothetical protein